MLSVRYLICTVCSTYSMIRVKLYQAFVMSGGSNARLYRGDEIIEMEFWGMDEAGDHEFLEAPTAL